MFLQPMEIAIYSQAVNRLLKTSSLIEQRVKKTLKPYGITHQQFHILRILSKANPYAISPKEIKNNMVISSPDVTRILDRMVDKEWIHRKTCESNRRRVDVSISTLGKEHFEIVNVTLQNDINKYLAARLSKDDIYNLLSLISKIDRSTNEILRSKTQ